MVVLLALIVYLVVAAGIALLFGRVISVADREHDREAFERAARPSATGELLIRR